MECFIWLFVLLRVPESTLAENSWQRRIRRGSFKVTAPFWLWALHPFHPLPLTYLCTNDMEDEWPLTGGATEASSCLPPPSINHHITTNPDTTWRNTTQTMKGQLPLQTAARLMMHFPPQTHQKLDSVNFILFATRTTSHWQFSLNQKPTGRVFVWCPLEEINDLHSVWAAKVMNSPEQHTMKSFLNPYTAQFIVVFKQCLAGCLSAILPTLYLFPVRCSS